MAATIPRNNINDEASPSTRKLMVRSYEGNVYHDVSTAPARDCTASEIPIIDLTGMFADLHARKKVAAEILHAADTSGFFYIKNHGIPAEILHGALDKAKEFFKLPFDKKRRMATDASAYGYHGLYENQVNPTQSKDRRESFLSHYEPSFDPDYYGRLHHVPQKVWDHLPKDFSIWEQDDVCPGFKDAVISYWQACLATSRRLIKLIALALELPEDYFDKYTTYPGSDFAINYYPGHGEEEVQDLEEVGIGAHTDLQILTLLWQDEHKGLQILNKDKEWVFAPPIEGTIVVNIGDFLMRLTNDRLKSTVHRVLQHGKEDRFSLPFFFGFNFDEKLGVLPTCTDKDNPPKYEPATCGELIAKRLALGSKDP